MIIPFSAGSKRKDREQTVVSFKNQNVWKHNWSLSESDFERVFGFTRTHNYFQWLLPWPFYGIFSLKIPGQLTRLTWYDDGPRAVVDNRIWLSRTRAIVPGGRMNYSDEQWEKGADVGDNTSTTKEKTESRWVVCVWCELSNLLHGSSQGSK